MGGEGVQVEIATRQVIASSKVDLGQCTVQQHEPVPSFKCPEGVLGVASV